MNLEAFFSAIQSAIEKHPALGYTGTIAGVAGGVMSYVEAATKILGLVSILIGITVGMLTFRIQSRVWRRAQEEDAAKKRP